MAQALRIDDVVTDADGQLSIHYTAGPDPLPPSWGGAGWNPGTRADVLTNLRDFTFEELTMMRFLLAAWAAKDATLTQLAQIRGKTMTIDLTAAQPGQVIRLN